MTKKVLVNLDMCQNELQNPVAHNLASAPANPVKGQEYFNTADNQKYIWNGAAWVSETMQGVTYTAGNGINSTSLGNGTIDVLDASTSQKGIIEIATDTEASTGTSTTLAITPKQLATATNGLIKLTDLSIDSGSSNYLGYDNTTGKISAKVDTTVGTVNTNLVTSGAVKTYVDNAVSGAIIPKASISSTSSLPTLVKAHVGWMYNFSASFTTTADFVEGAGQTYPAGTNVVVVEYSTDVYKYDVFSGFVDTSSFITASSANTLTNKTIDADDNTISDLTTSNFKSGTIVTSVGSTGADTSIPTEKAVRSAISTATTNIANVYSTTNPALTSSGGICTWTVTHSLGSNVLISIYEVSSNEEVVCDKVKTSSSVATIKINSASNITAGTYSVVVIGK